MSQRRRLFRLPWRSKTQIRADVETELAFHLDERIDDLIAHGASRETARAQAIREFGDIDDARRYMGDMDRDLEAARRRSDIMNDFVQDIGYAFRKLRASPAFTLAAVITLALGIGANTAIFSVVNTVLLQPLPFAEPDRLIRLRFSQNGHGDAGTPMDLIDYSTRTKSFVGFSVMEPTTANLSREAGDAERLQGVRVGANWFDLLAVKPLVGRFFVSGEDKQGAPAVAVLSEGLWRRDFSADSAIVGRTVRINARAFTVIGVAQSGHTYPMTVDVWMPKQFDAQELSDASRGARWLAFLGRIKSGADVDAAKAEVVRVSEAMEQRFPEDYRERRAKAVALHDYMVGDLRKPLLVILGAVVFVLLIACANVANLQLVRAQARESELAIRTALGAGRGRLVRQLMTESVIVAVIGGAVGVLLAKLAIAKLLASAPASLVYAQHASIDLTTLVVTGAVALLTGLLFGALPALQVGRAELASVLRAGGRGTKSRHGANRTKRAIVVAELALAVMLLSGAGLLLRSFGQLMSVDPGFQPDGVLSMKVALPSVKYDSTAIRNFIRTAQERMRALPGVESAALATMVPLDDGGYGFTFTVRGRTYARSSDKPSSEVRVVTPDFFRVMGMPVLRGRVIATTDVASAPKAYVVNSAYAKRFFPNEDAIGQAIRIEWGEDPVGETNVIVGVVGDVHSSGLDQEAEPTIYAALAQYPMNGLTLVARSAAPTTLAAPLRGIVRDLDRDVPVYSVMTMSERVAASVGPQRFYATLIGMFAGVALLLAAVGLYGVIAYAVSERTHELGVRVALGASADRITRMVIGEGLVITGIGAVIGVGGAIATGRIVSSLLFGVSARDPMTLSVVVGSLALVAALASWIPARRASRVDPLIAMRGD